MTEGQIAVYLGFTENTYRLLIPYGANFPDMSPTLNTITPGGYESKKVLIPEEGRAIFAYPYPQTISEEAGSEFLGTPFVWKRSDGTLAVAHMWPVKYNKKFKLDYTTTITNPDTDKFSEQAVTEITHAGGLLFNNTNITVLYCKKTDVNMKKVYVGTPQLLLNMLQDNPTIMSELNILQLTNNGFIAGTVDGDGKTSSIEFTFSSEPIEYALYTKQGWNIMACITAMHQFIKDRTLIQN